MALSQEMMNYLAQAFGPAALRNGLQVRGDERVNLARQLGIPVEDLGEGNYRYDENALANAFMRQQYNQYVPQDLRDYFSGPGGGEVFMGANDQMLMIDPATGQPVQAWGAGVSTDEGNVLDRLALPDRLGQKYGNQLGAKVLQKEVWDDTLLDKAMPFIAAAPWAAALLPGMVGAEAAAAGAAEAGAAGAFDAAGMAGLESGFGIGGAGMGGGSASFLGPATGTIEAAPVIGASGYPTAAGLPGSLMPGAVPPVDPTFGNALIQTAPGVYASPGATGYIGAAGLGGPVYGADIPSVGVGGGGAGGGGMPKPPVPPGSTTVLGQLKDLAKDVSPYAPLLGMATGGLLGATGGSGQAGTITVEEGIPDWLMPYVKPQLDKYATEVQNYQIDPYGVMPAAMQEFKNTVSGMYLDPSTNKWLEEYYKLGAERIKGTLSPSFGHMQAFGSHSGYNEALSRGLGDFAVGLYGGNYAKERDRQTQMTATAPQFLTQSSTAAFAPYTQYLNAVGNLGKKKDQPYFEPSQMQNILGGAMMGYGLGNIFK